MRMQIYLATLMIALPFAAQAQDVEQLPAAEERAVEAQQRDAAWYLEHPEARAALLAECDKDSDADNNPDCVAAEKADGKVNAGQTH